MKPDKSNMENSRGKKNTYPSPKTKSVCHRSPNKLYLPVIHDPCRKLEHPTRGTKAWVRGEGGKKFPSPLEKFREYALCRPLKEAKAIEVSLNKLQKTSPFPTLF